MDGMKLGVGLMVLAAFVAEVSRADSMPSDSISAWATHSSGTTCSRIDFSPVQALLDSAVQEGRTRAGIV